METLSGPASDVRHLTETSGRISGNGLPGGVRGSIRTRHACSLRIGGKPVRIDLPGATNLSDGDLLTVVGVRKEDGVHALVMRNESTGVEHATPAWSSTLVGVVLLVVGLPLTLVIIGIPMMILGGVVLWFSRRQARALALLRTAPRLQIVA